RSIATTDRSMKLVEMLVGGLLGTVGRIVAGQNVLADGVPRSESIGGSLGFHLTNSTQHAQADVPRPTLFWRQLKAASLGMVEDGLDRFLLDRQRIDAGSGSSSLSTSLTLWSSDLLFGDRGLLHRSHVLTEPGQTFPHHVRIFDTVQDV